MLKKRIEDDLPSVEEALADLKHAWDDCQKAEEEFKVLLNNFIKEV